jgi:hypothetical protein
MEKTHGKDPLCRAPEKKRTVKIFTHGKLRFSRSELKQKTDNITVLPLGGIVYRKRHQIDRHISLIADIISALSPNRIHKDTHSCPSELLFRHQLVRWHGDADVYARPA